MTIEWYLLNLNPNYEITKTGVIRNKNTKYILKPQERGGYLRVGLSDNGKRKTYSVHRLVAEQFIPNPLYKEEVNHKDLDKKNNNIDNLEWVTRQENTDHKMKMYGEELNKKLKKGIIKAINKNKKPVLCFSIDNKFIKEYESMSEAERLTGINRKSIRYCILGKRQEAGGFKWKLREGSTTIENNPKRT